MKIIEIKAVVLETRNVTLQAEVGVKRVCTEAVSFFKCFVSWLAVDGNSQDNVKTRKK